MIDARAIIPEMEVYAADGVHIGSVDSVENGRIRLNTVASSVPVETGHDYYVLLDEVVRVEGNRIHVAGDGAVAVHPRRGADADYRERGAIEPGATLNR